MSSDSALKAQPEYKAGYIAGYCAGRRKREAVGNASHTYKRVPWRCSSCGSSGIVLWRDDDDNERKQWRMDQSHQSHSHGRCRDPRLVRLTAKQTRVLMESQIHE